MSLLTKQRPQHSRTADFLNDRFWRDNRKEYQAWHSYILSHLMDYFGWPRHARAQKGPDDTPTPACPTNCPSNTRADAALNIASQKKDKHELIPGKSTWVGPLTASTPAGLVFYRLQSCDLLQTALVLLLVVAVR